MQDDKNELLMIENSNMSSMIEDGFFGNIPHAKALGIEFVSALPYRASMKLPYRDELIGNPVTGTLHGGVLISLMDSVGGMTVFCSLSEMVSIATLDLRLDYMKPALVGQDIIAEGECYKKTNSIAFIRAIAYQGSSENLVASCVATFMLSSNSKNQNKGVK